MSNSQFALLGERRFGPLFFTQFLGAFNDSLFRNALIVLLAFSAPSVWFSQDTLINLGAALFVIPYFLFSALAGQLADKFEKSLLIRLIKLSEVFLAILAVIGFYLNSILLLMTSLFLLGTHSTFFGPIKYSILPQTLKDPELIDGNALIEMGTFIAILIGTMLGALLVGIPKMGLVWISVTMGMASIVGLGSSLFIPETQLLATNIKIDWHPFKQTATMIKKAYQEKVPYISIIGISWFWLYGSMFLTQSANYTKVILSGNEQVATILLTTFSLGTGLGSVLCAKFSDKKIEMGLVPLGAIGLTLFALDLVFAHRSKPDDILNAIGFLSHFQSWRILIDATLMGVSGGIYLVPLYALLQKRTDPTLRSRMIAANNVINAIFMTSASAIAILFLNLGLTIPQLFLFTAILNALIAFYMFNKVPEFSVRAIAWLYSRFNQMFTSILNPQHLPLGYSQKQNLETLPMEGPALLICPTFSYSKIFLLLAAAKRPIRFAIEKKYLKIPFLGYVLKNSQAIVIDNLNKTILKEQLLHEIKEAFTQGEIVGIFENNILNNHEQWTKIEKDIVTFAKEQAIPLLPLKLNSHYSLSLN